MVPHHKTGNGSTAADFLTHCFASGETIALLLRREFHSRTLQRIIQLETALALGYLGWLAHENSTGANVYVAANPLRSGSRRRTKVCIATGRPLYLDLDTDGQARLASLQSSHAVPPPNAVLSTSLGKYQVLWRVGGLTLDQQESALKLLAINAAFIHASADDVVDKALNYVFSKDRDFQEFLKTPQANQVASTLRVRRGPNKDTPAQPAKKLVAGVGSRASVPISKA